MFLQPPAGPPVDLVDPGVLLGAVAGIAFFTVLAALSRQRILAVICRLGAIACALCPALMAWSWWSVADPTGSLAGRDVSAMQDVLGVAVNSPSLPDLQVGPPTALEALTLVWAAVLVAFFLLTVRAERRAS